MNDGELQRRLLAAMFSPSVRLMGSYACLKYAESCERNHIDAAELRELAALLDPRPAVAADADDDVLTPRIRRREQWRAASATYRAKRKADRLTAAG